MCQEAHLYIWTNAPPQGYDGTMSDIQRPGDPTRPRYLGIWVAVVLNLVLFGGASAVVADVFYRMMLGI
ncbi:MAG: hypothetical protein EB039_03300 [Proteobacteria bacterium]|nr:hypothetical protein [Pseudomonadota bacterium]